VAALTTSTFRLISTPYVLSEHEKMSSLIGPQSGTWRAYMIRQMFSSDDACATLSIPLSLRLPRDQMVWAYNPKGESQSKAFIKWLWLPHQARLMEYHQNAESGVSFGRQSEFSICQIRLRPLPDEQVGIYSPPKSIYVTEKSLMILPVKLVAWIQKRSDMTFGSVKRPREIWQPARTPFDTRGADFYEFVDLLWHLINSFNLWVMSY